MMKVKENIHDNSALNQDTSLELSQIINPV